MSFRRSVATNESGQALPEFALVLPILMLVLVAMLDFGKAFNYWIDATQISAAGARHAVVNRKPDPANPASLQVQLREQADTAELRNTDPTKPVHSQVCVDFPNGTTNTGDPVRVRMIFTYNWIQLLGDEIGPTQTITTSAIMRLEGVPTNYSAGCA